MYTNGLIFFNRSLQLLFYERTTSECANNSTACSGGSRISHGGCAPIRGGMDLRCGHFLVKMYVKMKELGPMGGVRRARPPPRSANGMGFNCFKILYGICYVPFTAQFCILLFNYILLFLIQPKPIEVFIQIS